ncbi:MFS transporter [Vibrio ostreicida]|uniref:MFS transporter n=1 Tax=Vibrio ostreicida TaxID=526588 RepID=UPI00387E65C5
MKTKPSLSLMVVMLMFPQIVETIYSPALGSIAQSFSVSYSQAAQTLSVYFLSFAMGVLVWGILADKLGRRPTMMAGLFIYSGAVLVAMQTESFTLIMAARALSAFGIAVGSVVTQTMLRDAFSGEALARYLALWESALNEPCVRHALRRATHCNGWTSLCVFIIVRDGNAVIFL